MDSVFFAKPGEKGLNETSATKLCAIASNLKTKDEARLNELSFLNVTADIVGSSGKKIEVEFGTDDDLLKEITTVAHRIGTLNGFISWCREASKALDKHRNAVARQSFQDWAAIVGEEIPESPSVDFYCKSYTMDDAIEMMSIKERAEYLALEAKAAALGKLIHPDGSFDNARNALHKRLANPTKVNGSGRDMVVYYYTPSTTPELVDSTYETMQKQYQNYESSLNHIKSDLRKKVADLNRAATTEYQQALNDHQAECEKYSVAHRAQYTRFTAWLNDQVEEAAKLKIAIPDCYQELLAKLYEVGK